MSTRASLLILAVFTPSLVFAQASLLLVSTPTQVCPAANTTVGSFSLQNPLPTPQTIPANAVITLTFNAPVVAPPAVSGAGNVSVSFSDRTVTVTLASNATLATASSVTFSGARLNLLGFAGGQNSSVAITATPANAVTFFGSNQIVVARADTTACSTSPLPSVSPGGVVNAASFTQGPVTPGSIVAIFGTNLATGTAAATKLPLPGSLSGAQVLIGGLAAPLFFVSANQINAQVPWELTGRTQASLVVSVNSATSNPVSVSLAPSAPGIFTTDSSGRGQSATVIATTGEFAAPAGSLPGRAARPAVRGDFVSIFSTGLGGVTNQPATGAAALNNPLSQSLAKPTVTVGGVPATAVFSGLAPFFAGLYQVNVQVPAGAPLGDAVPIVVSAGAVSSNTSTIAVGDLSATGAIPPEGGKVELPGFGSAIFSANSFPGPQTVTVSATASADTKADYEQTAIVFEAGPRVPWEFRINTGSTQPGTDFTVVLPVPDWFLGSLPSNFEIQTFAQIYEEGALDVLDHFELFPPVFDPAAKTLQVTLPNWAFTNRRRTDQTFEAIVVIGSTPKAGSAPTATRASGTEGPPFARREDPLAHVLAPWLAQEDQACQGNPIGSPFAGDPLVTSSYTARRCLPGEACRPHLGTDLRAADGTPLFPVADGKVFVIGDRGLSEGKSWGHFVLIKHIGPDGRFNGCMTVYAHLQPDSTRDLREGQPVEKGKTPIGRTDCTGGCRDPHLHLEYVCNCRSGVYNKCPKIDPQPCLSKNPVLTVIKTGSGKGTVASSPAGIACGPGCSSSSASFPPGTPVTLTAQADQGSKFTGFFPCSDPCVVTMDQDKQVQANFDLVSTGGGGGSTLLIPPFQGLEGCVDTFTGKSIVDAQTLVAWGGAPQASYTWSISNLSSFPPGTTVEPTTGIFRWNGGTVVAGSYTFNMTVSDGTNTASGNFSLRVDTASSAPVGGIPGVGCPAALFQQSSLRTFPLPNATAGSAYGAALYVTVGSSGSVGGDLKLPLTWSLASGSLPPGLRLDSSTGVVWGTTSGGSAQTFSFTIRVANRAGEVAICPNAGTCPTYQIAVQ